MDKKIVRIERLVKFETQKLNSIAQDVLSLTNRHHRVGKEINRLSESIQSSCMAQARDFDQLSSRRTFAVMAENLRGKISEFRGYEERLQREIDNAREKLAEQKVRVNVLEQLLGDLKNAQRASLDEEQLRELLDIANRRFLELHQ